MIDGEIKVGMMFWSIADLSALSSESTPIRPWPGTVTNCYSPESKVFGLSLTVSNEDGNPVVLMPGTVFASRSSVYIRELDAWEAYIDAVAKTRDRAAAEFRYASEKAWDLRLAMSRTARERLG